MNKSRNVIVLVTVAIIAIIAITVIILSPSMNLETYNAVNNFGLAIHPIYPSFSSPESGFTINNNTLSVSDYAIYKTGYYSINGGTWQPFTLTGTILSGNWLNGNANYNLPTFSAGESYVVTYTCTKNSGAWNCHDNKWQLQIINNGNSSTISWTNELMINGGFEEGTLNGWTISAGGWRVGNHLSNAQFVLPEQGNYQAYINGTSDVNGFIYQDVNLTNIANYIDTGKAIINASGWGVSSESKDQDLSRIKIIFLNSAKWTISTAIDSDDVSSGAWWQKRIFNYPIPSGTRYVRMWGNTYEQGYSSGNLDSFSVKTGRSEAVILPACTPSCSGKQCGSDGCNGTCGTCLATQTCNSNNQCINNVVTATCSDGIQNQAETGIDCGGSCKACQVSTGTTYYISANGSDSASGSINSPWSTLAHACSIVKTSGDIIHVKQGIYTANTQCNLAVGVSIEGEGVNSIIKSHLTDDFEIILSSPSAGTNGNQHISNIKMDGNSLSGFGAIKVYNRNNVDIYSNTFVHFSHYAAGFDVYRAGDVEPAIYGTGNRFHDNIVNDCSGWFPPGAKDTGGEGKGAITIDGQSNMLIYNNNLNQTSRSADSSGYLIKGVPGFNKDIKIYNNNITAGPYDSSTWDFAIELWYSQGGIEIYDNNITGSVDFGEPVTKGTYAYGAWVHDNTIGRPVLGQYEGFRGILLEYAAENVIIERNYFKNICQGIYIHGDYRGPTGFEDINIRYNIFSNIGVNDLGETNICSGIEYDEDYTERNDWTDNFNVYNNVIIAHKGNKITRYGIEIPSSWPATHVNIKNNIIEGFDNAGIYMLGSNGQTTDYLSIQNNILLGNGGDDAPVFSSITPTHYNVDNTLAGTDPSFADMSNNDFHLKYRSPAIDNGINVGLTSDYEGIIVPQGSAPDIGAFEYR